VAPALEHPFPQVGRNRSGPQLRVVEITHGDSHPDVTLDRTSAYQAAGVDSATTLRTGEREIVPF